MTSTDDAEDWVFHQLENTTHLLHGVVHSNGYGHLLRVNGREGGSRILSGYHIMDFWDRLCKILGVRLRSFIVTTASRLFSNGSVSIMFMSQLVSSPQSFSSRIIFYIYIYIFASFFPPPFPPSCYIVRSSVKRSVL